MEERALTGIVIDPGHGGVDSGAVGNGIIEKNLTLDISKYMYDRFKELGVPVALTRTGDTTLDASDRPGVALNKFGSSSNVLVISNHINAGGGEGAEVIYALRNKDTLAKNILEEIGKEGQKTRKYYQRRLPSDSSKDYYYMLRNTPNTESLIVEYGFLDNAADANRLKSNYKDYAEAVVRAVADYKNINYVPISGSNYYIVKKGDTLWSIAKANNISVNKLKEINNLTTNSLSIGDILKLTDESEKIPSGTTSTYVVKRGDTLYSIARDNNISVTELKNANNLASNTLSIGQVLTIPNSVVEETPITDNTYIVKSGDTLYSIANKYNVTVSELKNANNLTSNTLSLNQELIIPANSSLDYQTYTVKKGDTLYSIARNYNVSVNDIKNLNNLTNNVLNIGQSLLIPS